MVVGEEIPSTYARCDKPRQCDLVQKVHGKEREGVCEQVANSLMVFLAPIRCDALCFMDIDSSTSSEPVHVTELVLVSLRIRMHSFSRSALLCVTPKAYESDSPSGNRKQPVMTTLLGLRLPKSSSFCSKLIDAPSKAPKPPPEDMKLVHCSSKLTQYPHAVHSPKVVETPIIAVLSKTQIRDPCNRLESAMSGLSSITLYSNAKAELPSNTVMHMRRTISSNNQCTRGG